MTCYLTQTKQKKSLFIFTMVWVIYQSCIFIAKNSFCFFKWNFMFGKILLCFIIIPTKIYIFYNDIIMILDIFVKCFLFLHKFLYNYLKKLWVFLISFEVLVKCGSQNDLSFFGSLKMFNRQTQRLNTKICFLLQSF